MSCASCRSSSRFWWRNCSQAQALLSSSDSREIDLRALVEAELAAHGHQGPDDVRITLDGPPARLPPSSAQALALALHELATNALKYGALDQEGGRLSVRWSLDLGAPEPCATLFWQESGADMLDGGVPKRKGYGLERIERALPNQLDASSELTFGEDGVRCVISVPVVPPADGAPQ